MTDLAPNMATSWAQKYESIQIEIDQAKRYPAFFKPEYVESLDKQAQDALVSYRFWLLQD